MIILGIDPGTASTGFGVIEKQGKELRCLDYGIIATQAGVAPEKRLAILQLQLNRVLGQYKPDIMVVESLFFFKNLKTVMPVSEAKGVIMLCAAKKKIGVVQLTPLQVKMAICQYGRAEKKQIQRMVKEMLNLKELPKPDDAADGLALALSWTFMKKPAEEN